MQCKPEFAGEVALLCCGGMLLSATKTLPTGLKTGNGRKDRLLVQWQTSGP